jgi:FkbM family methyltransferase
MQILKKIKQSVYHWLSKQRPTSCGKRLLSINQSLFEALENKNNDFKTNGEKWLIDSLDSDKAIIVFDVGANIGDWSKMAYSKNKNAIIHSFEPVPAIFEKLAENTNGIDQISINNLALGEKEDVLQMNYYPSNSIFSSFYHHPMGKNQSNVVEVKVMSGDAYCQLHNVEFIDFLKIDVEGFESKVLFGFDRMFAEKRIGMVQFEYGDLVLKTGFLLRDFYEFFEKNNYKVGKLFPEFIEFGEYSYKKENFLPSNFVAIHNSELPL